MPAMPAFLQDMLARCCFCPLPPFLTNRRWPDVDKQEHLVQPASGEYDDL
jgi:hypothetical protein